MDFGNYYFSIQFSGELWLCMGGLEVDIGRMVSRMAHIYFGLTWWRAPSLPDLMVCELFLALMIKSMAQLPAMAVAKQEGLHWEKACAKLKSQAPQTLYQAN